MQGNLHLKNGDVGSAQMSFQAISTLSRSKGKQSSGKRDQYALMSLANIEFGMGEKQREKNQKNQNGYLNDKAKSHFETASKIYERALIEQPKNVYAANGLGIVLAELGHNQAATDVFSKINEQSSMLHSRINLAHL
jgi:RNA polymerase-associated protein CTR9